MNGKMIISLALVLAMVVGAFGMVMPMAEAEIVNVDNTRNLYVPIPWGTNLDNANRFVGQQGVDFYVYWYNGNDAYADDAYVDNMVCTFDTTVMVNGVLQTTSPITWETRTVTPDSTDQLGEFSSYEFSTFIFDINANAPVGTYNLTCRLNFKDGLGAMTVGTAMAFIEFEVVQRVNFADIEGLLPGDKNKNVDVDGWANSVPWDERMFDITLTVTRPDTAFTWYGITGASATATWSGGNGWSGSSWHSFPFMLSVANNKAVGTYAGTYTLTYTTNDDVDCTETGTINFIVGNLAMLSASVGTSTIAQGTTSTTMTLTFTNTGNVALYDVRVWIDQASDAFFRTQADHWEGDETVTFGWIELGNMAVGASAPAQEMDVSIDLYIPEGQHKLMFGFDAMYIDPDAQAYRDAYAWWDDWGIQNIPRVDMAGDTYNLDPDSSTIEGPFVWIEVTDAAMSVQIQSATFISTGYQLLDNALTLNIKNMENINYGNVVIQIETNTANSPFLNVVNPTATLSEETTTTARPYPYNEPAGTLYAASERTATVQVSLKADAELGVHMVPVTIRAFNDDMGESVSTTVTARITIRGIGPQLEVTTVAPETVKAGKAFTLSVTFMNVGDDTARNIIINSANWFYDQETTTDGNYAQPQPNALPLFVGDLAPGETLTVEIPMMANSDMSKGHVYAMLFEMDYVDSFGHGPATGTFQVSVKSSGMGGSVLGMLYWSFVLLAIIVAIFLIILAVFYVKKNKKPKVAPEQQYNQPPPPPEQMMEP